MAKSVCIIGAGPSGLVAAKSFLHDAPKEFFKVTIFDSQHDIGGLWPTSKSDTGRQIHPLMIINQSKHTVQFGDLAWDADTPQLPQAWLVGKYLSKYHDRWLKGRKQCELRLRTKVVKAERMGESKDWKVTTESNGLESSKIFNHVVFAGGIHGRPVMPDIPRQNSDIPIIHTSQYRNLRGLLGTERTGGGKILMLGGQQSVVEVASTISLQLNAAQNSPETSDIPDVDSYSVHHILHKPIWNFTMFTSPEPMAAAAPFVPLDFNMYNRSFRPPPVVDVMGHLTEERAKSFHDMFELVCGTDQSIFSDHLQVTSDQRTQVPLVTMNDFYSDLVRAGSITLSKGKLERIDGNTATLSPHGEKVENIAAVVVGTGFKADLSFLPQDDLKTLHFSDQYHSLPVALAFHGTHHPDVPHLGFVGFYRGPYWGVMQLQSMFLAKLWSSGNQIPDEIRSKLESDNSIQRTLDLRGDPMGSQFPTDYTFLMQELGEALSITPYSPSIDKIPNLSANNSPLNMLIPAHYMGNHEDQATRETARSLVEDMMQTTIDSLTTPRFVSWAVFRSLLGTWRLERDVKSSLPSHPSGNFSGTARFLIREKTLEGLSTTNLNGEQGGSSSFDQGGLEYLYVEEGDFQTEQGFGFKATRRYVWRYDEKKDQISVWFAKPEDVKRADYLFHEIEFEQPTTREHGWPAKAGHLCIDDYYDVKYNFVFKAVNLEKWTIDYSVKGPKKDYSIQGVYSRP